MYIAAINKAVVVTSAVIALLVEGGNTAAIGSMVSLRMVAKKSLGAYVLD